MSSKARTALALVAVFAVAGCGSTTKQQQDTGFSQLDINQDSSSLKQALVLDFQSISQPASMGESLTQTFAPATGTGADRLLATAQTTDCGSQTGVATDSDNDQIPQDLTYHYTNCPIVDGAYSASVRVKDTDPGNAKSGFIAQLSGLTYLGSDGVKLTASRSLSLAASAGIYSLRSSMTLNRTADLNVFNVNSEMDGMYAPDGTATPWVAGTIEAAGTLTLSRATDSDKVLQVTIDHVHMSLSCATGITAGKVTFTDTKKNHLIMTYTSCGQMTASYNGFQVQ